MNKTAMKRKHWKEWIFFFFCFTQKEMLKERMSKKLLNNKKRVNPSI